MGARPNSAGVPASSSVANQHVFFELGDHLGSTSTVLGKDTGELVERSTYQAYGAAEADYRPDRWDAFREDYRFTGKEEDVEVGLTYFGKRFYSAGLNRWMSPDPLALHDLGDADLNLYAYVRGQALKATDPLGLAETGVNSGEANMSVCAGSCTPSTDAQEDQSVYTPEMHQQEINEHYQQVRDPPLQDTAQVSDLYAAGSVARASLKLGMGGTHERRDGRRQAAP
jgi:RHS repeat-associated protein